MSDGGLMTLQTQNALAAGRQAPTMARGMNVAKARQASQDFEAFFLGQMLQPMFAGIETDETFGGGEAESMWRSFQVDEYGKAFARHGGIGIADMVFREMIKMQEGK
jgi:Rod binding domain-containing protein